LTSSTPSEHFCHVEVISRSPNAVLSAWDIPKAGLFQFRVKAPSMATLTPFCGHLFAIFYPFCFQLFHGKNVWILCKLFNSLWIKKVSTPNFSAIYNCIKKMAKDGEVAIEGVVTLIVLNSPQP
jgi:hypothetical protein